MYYQQNGLLDQGSDTRQKRTRQVDEPRRGVLPSSSYLWSLSVCYSNIWRTIVSTKEAAVAETSTIN